jgi:hypothetical protein
VARIETQGDRSVACPESGLEVEFDLAMLATGVRPIVELAEKDIVIVAGCIAANARRVISPAISPMDLREELESDTPPLVIDARDEREYDMESLGGSVSWTNARNLYGGFAFARKTIGKSKNG